MTFVEKKNVNTKTYSYSSYTKHDTRTDQNEKKNVQIEEKCGFVLQDSNSISLFLEMGETWFLQSSVKKFIQIVVMNNVSFLSCNWKYRKLQYEI